MCNIFRNQSRVQWCMLFFVADDDPKLYLLKTYSVRIMYCTKKVNIYQNIASEKDVFLYGYLYNKIIGASSQNEAFKRCSLKTSTVHCVAKGTVSRDFLLFVSFIN